MQPTRLAGSAEAIVLDATMRSQRGRTCVASQQSPVLALQAAAGNRATTLAVQRDRTGRLAPGPKPEVVTDASLSLARGTGRPTVTVAASTTIFATKEIDDEKSPAHGLLDVDPAKPLGDLQPTDRAEKVGTFWDGPDPAYHKDYIGIADPSKAIFPGIAAVPKAAALIGGPYLTSEGAPGGWIDAVGHLFPRPPLPADVKQGELADCGLLAALASLAAQQPSAITGMMKDHGGSVTVRLFDVTPPAGPGAPPLFTPRDVTVQKSVAAHGPGQPAFAQGAVWVQMIEKAYAAAGFVPDSYDVSRLRAFGTIEKSRPNIVLEHLLGRRSEHHQLAMGDGAGKRGSGVYSPEQLATFGFIVAALEQRKVVLAESKDVISSGRATRHSAGGESVAKGLVGGHAYSILDAAPRHPGPNDVRRVFVRNPWGRYGRTYAPGHRGAMADSPSSRDPSGRSTGAFWLELRDVTKRFDKVFTA